MVRVRKVALLGYPAVGLQWGEIAVRPPIRKNRGAPTNLRKVLRADALVPRLVLLLVTDPVSLCETWCDSQTYDIGKSSLAYQYVEQRFEEDYCTTIENHLTATVTINGREYELHLYDTMGVTELPSFPDEYLMMDGWILVYSVTSKRSFDVIKEIYDKLETSRPGPRSVPAVLVGNKADLTSEREVSEVDGRRMAAVCHALYTESSAKDNMGVADVFKLIILEIEKMQGEPVKPAPAAGAKSDCVLL